MKDSANTTFSITITLMINSPSSPLRFVGPLSLAAGTVGVAYSPVTFVASGGTGYAWSATGLPPGMGIDSSTGVLGGTPTALGTFNAQFVVTDAASDSFSINLPLTINPVACNYALSAGGQVFAPAGGSGSVGLTTPAGCGWSVSGVAGLDYSYQCNVRFRQRHDRLSGRGEYGNGANCYAYDRRNAVHGGPAGSHYRFESHWILGAPAGGGKLDHHVDAGQ